MIAAIVAAHLLLLGRPLAAVEYGDVPASVSEVRVFEWREGFEPIAVPSMQERSGATLIIDGTPSEMVVIVFRARDGRYLLDGPFAWPSRGTKRTLERRWLRSDTGALPHEAQTGAIVSWIRGDPAGGPWPRCFVAKAAWECWGVDPSNRGVVVVASAGRFWSVVTMPVASGSLRASGWGRLLLVSDSSGPGASAEIAFGVPVFPPSERFAAIRLASAVVPDTRATAISPGAIWITGGSIPPKAWIEIRTAQGGPTYLGLQDVAGGPASVPLTVRLTETRTVGGIVEGSDGRGAAGTLVTMFRLIDPPARDGDRVKPRVVFAAEMVAGDGGEFRFDAVGDGDYEVVAWHSQLGRASVLLSPAQSEIVLRLGAIGTIRGRVVGAKRPLSGVDIVSVPDAATFNAAADLTEIKGGDAKTGSDGRFTVMAASAGGGELRIGGGAYGVRRIALPRPPLPVLDLGDIEVAPGIDVIVVLDPDPKCPLRAVGPLGRTGLQIVAAAATPEGAYRIALPEAGRWEFGLVCDQGQRTLVPGSLQITEAHRGKEVRFVVR